MAFQNFVTLGHQERRLVIVGPCADGAFVLGGGPFQVPEGKAVPRIKVARLKEVRRKAYGGFEGPVRFLIPAAQSVSETEVI